MTEAQGLAAKRRYQRESQQLCHTCGGSGRILTRNSKTRAQKGGNSSYLKSLTPGQQSMQDRGRKGGRPKEPTLKELLAQGQARSVREPKKEMAPEGTNAPGVTVIDWAMRKPTNE